MYPHLKMETETQEQRGGSAVKSTELPRGAQVFRTPGAPARTSGRRRPTSNSHIRAPFTRQAHLPRVTGRLHPRRQITVRPTASSPPSVSPAGLGMGGWGKGGSQRKLPAAPSRAMRSGRDTAASAPGETAAVLPQQRLEGSLGTRRGEASSGPGAQAEGRGRAQKDASPRLAPSQEYSNISQSMNLPPWLSWTLVSATDPLTIP